MDIVGKVASCTRTSPTKLKPEMVKNADVAPCLHWDTVPCLPPSPHFRLTTYHLSLHGLGDRPLASIVMPAKDRTAEFHATLNSIKSRTALPSSSFSSKERNRESKQRLIPREDGVKANGKITGGTSEFGRMAGGIAKDINATTLKLQKLAQRMSRPTSSFFRTGTDEVGV